MEGTRQWGFPPAKHRHPTPTSSCQSGTAPQDDEAQTGSGRGDWRRDDDTASMRQSGALQQTPLSLKSIRIPAQEMLLCSLPWHLDWHREEKEATARETVSGPSAGGRPRTAEPRGQAPPVLQGPEPGEREGRPAAGAHASAPSCSGARRGQERASPPHERSPSHREAGRRAARAQTGTGELGASTPTPQQQRGHLQDPECQAPKEGAEQGPFPPHELGLQPPIHSTTSPKEGPQEQAPQAPGLQTSVPRVQPASSVPKVGSAKMAQDPTQLSALRRGAQWGGGQRSPVLERGGGGGLAEPAAGTDRDLYRAVSRRSLKRSAAMRAFDSSCSGMLLMSEEKGLSGFSRLISQLVLPAGGLRAQRSTPSSPALHHPWEVPAAPCSALTGVHTTKMTKTQRDDHVRAQREDGI